MSRFCAVCATYCDSTGFCLNPLCASRSGWGHTWSAKVGHKYQCVGSPNWLCISLNEESISLTGPGPCRSIITLPLAKFYAEWHPVID